MRHLAWTLPITCLLAACGPQQYCAIVKDAGFSCLRPASTLVPPGTIVVKPGGSPSPAERICTQAASLGGNLQVADSSTSYQELIEKVSRSVTLEGDYLKQITADASMSSIKSITQQLVNPRIYDLDWTTVQKSVANRDPVCQALIDKFRSQDVPVTMMRAVLEADVVYKAEFSSAASLDAATKEIIMKGLAVKLGAKQETATTNTVSGQGLFWGFIDSPLMATLRPFKETSGPPVAGAGDQNIALDQRVWRDVNVSVVERVQ